MEAISALSVVTCPSSPANAVTASVQPGLSLRILRAIDSLLRALIDSSWSLSSPISRRSTSTSFLAALTIMVRSRETSLVSALHSLSALSLPIIMGCFFFRQWIVPDRLSSTALSIRTSDPRTSTAGDCEWLSPSISNVVVTMARDSSNRRRSSDAGVESPWRASTQFLATLVEKVGSCAGSIANERPGASIESTDRLSSMARWVLIPSLPPNATQSTQSNAVALHTERSWSAICGLA